METRILLCVSENKNWSTEILFFSFKSILKPFFEEIAIFVTAIPIPPKSIPIAEFIIPSLLAFSKFLYVRSPSLLFTTGFFDFS